MACLSLSFQAIQTVPTGLSGEPPPGPAIQLMATPRSARLSATAPSTISVTTSSLTAPNLLSESFDTPKILCLEIFE